MLPSPRPALLLITAPQGLEDERQLWRWGVNVNLRGTRLLVPAEQAEERRKQD